MWLELQVYFQIVIKLQDYNYSFKRNSPHHKVSDHVHGIFSMNHSTQGHAVMEPFVIASNRQLSKLHPILTFLLPLFKNTMMINSVARQILVNGGGIVEITSTPGKYSLELSSKLYGALWRFDREALPEDLIARYLYMDTTLLCMIQG